MWGMRFTCKILNPEFIWRIKNNKNPNFISIEYMLIKSNSKKLLLNCITINKVQTFWSWFCNPCLKHPEFAVEPPKKKGARVLRKKKKKGVLGAGTALPNWKLSWAFWGWTFTMPPWPCWPQVFNFRYRLRNCYLHPTPENLA